MTREHILQAGALNGPDDGMGSWLSQAFKGQGPLAPVAAVASSLVPGPAGGLLQSIFGPKPAAPVYGPPTPQPTAPASGSSYTPLIVVGIGLALLFVLSRQ